MIVFKFGPAFLEDGLAGYWWIALAGPLVCCLLLFTWWLTASRATAKERLLGLLALLASLAITIFLAHPTMRGPATAHLTLPMGMFAFGLAAHLTRRGQPGARTARALICAIVAFGFSILLRSEGLTGNYVLSLRWRWSPTAESKMLASRSLESGHPTNATSSINPLLVDRIEKGFAAPEWPGFRGPDRSGRSTSPPIATNWSAHPPKQLWKISVGPAWSSFAVAGSQIFTQEQRGPNETVVCYDAETGRELWVQSTATRFDEPLGGPGPRATPTLAVGGLFATGATGTLLRLNPTNGAVVWTQSLKELSGREVPTWGFAASPLVVDSIVIVHAGGPGNKGLLGFDHATGSLRWSAAAGHDSYSSPQLNRIAGEDLVLMLSNEGLLFVRPSNGEKRFNYEWKYMSYRALQPCVVGEDTILLPTGLNAGTRAIRVTKSNDVFTTTELWTSRQLKPDFTDLVTFQGHVYGIDGGLFTCVDLQTGERKWKGGRYGKGQVLLLEKSGLLLVAAEDGRVVLLRADPSEHVELDSFKALEGKTWNHPVVVGDRLYVRNAQEAAAYHFQ